MVISGPGLLFASISTVLVSAKDVVSKKIASSIDPSLSSFASFFFALPFYLAAIASAYFLGFETFLIMKGFILAVVLRSITDTFAETLKMHALKAGDLSLVISLISLHPLFLLFFSPIITGDPLTGNIVQGVILTVIGNLIIFYKPEGSISKRGVLLGLGTALFFSLNNCFDRMSVQSASPLLSGFSMTALSCVFLTPALKIEKSISSLTSHSRPLLLRGALEVGFMVSKLSALTVLSAPQVSAILRLSVLLSMFGGSVMLKEKGLIRNLLGGALSIIGVTIAVI